MTECGVPIWGRKYLNECTPFSGVRQCIGLSRPNLNLFQMLLIMHTTRMDMLIESNTTSKQCLISKFEETFRKSRQC